MSETLKKSIEEFTAFANGDGTNIEVRTYDVTKAPNFNGAEIKAVRKKLNLSRAVFADILDVSPRTVERWEVDGAKPSGSANRLIQLLDKKPAILVQIIKEVSANEN